MSTTEAFDSLCTIILPDAANYHVDLVFDLISFAIRNKTKHHSSAAAEPHFSRWNAPSHVYSPEQSSKELAESLIARHDSERVTQQSVAPTWDERTYQLKIDLTQRLYQAVCNREFEVWGLSGETVKRLPTTQDEVVFWAKTASIFKPDLVKFCSAQRVSVEFAREAAQTDSVSIQQDSSNAPNIDVKVNTQNERSHLSPPGRMPKIRIGKLTIAAAWELELELGRRALPSEVMQRLQLWVETHEGDSLKHTNKKNCVAWETVKGKPKIYDLEACGAALRTWHTSRA